MNNMGTIFGAICGSKLGEHLRKKKDEKQNTQKEKFRAASKPLTQQSFEEWKAANKKQP